MKRILMLTVAFMLCVSCFVFTACDSKSENQNETTNTTDDSPSAGDTPKDAPYELEFVSNGDGTCYVSEITINPLYGKEFVLEIPKKSPSGDRVTEIRPDCFDNLLPSVMTEESYQKIDKKLR